MSDAGRGNSSSMTRCGQPDPTNSGAPCDQDAGYSVRLTGFHGVPGEQTVEVCADHLAWWREAFPDSILAARSLPGGTG